MKILSLKNNFFILSMFFFQQSLNAQAFYVDGDLQVNSIPFGFHDSTQCYSNVGFQYFIMKSNSFLGEVIEVKDPFTGSVIQSFVNISGTANFNETFNGYSNIVPDYMISGGNALGYFPPLKVTCSTDTIPLIDNLIMIPVSNPCSYENVTGIVYIDNNNDCNFDSGDNPLNMTQVNGGVNTSNGNYNTYAYTTAGNYSLLVQESWLVDYTVSIPSIYQFIFPLSSCQAPSYTSSTLPQSNFDFSLNCGGNIDAMAYISGPQNVRPLIPFNIYASVANVGCDTISGDLKLVLDPNVTYSSALSSNPASSISGDTLIWNYVDLTSVGSGSGYWNNFFSGVHLTPNVSVNIGDTLCFSISTNLFSNDLNLSNNLHSICIPVVNSYDPNIKSVVPKGEGIEGNISASTTPMSYTVEFQNTGNAPALNIQIIDTLDSDLDLSTFRILASSHAMTPTWLASNIVAFNFYSINLPDSTTDEVHSHGYVSYEISQNSNLSVGTEIENTAYIYFDSNPAIVTNTTLNTISELSVAENNQLTYSLFPNPCNDKLNIQLNSTGNSSIQISDLFGRIVYSNTFNETSVEIESTDFSSGIYTIEIIQNNLVSKQQIVVQH